MFFLRASSHLRGEKEATGDWHPRESNKRGQGTLKEVHASGGDPAQAGNGVCEFKQGVRTGITGIRLVQHGVRVAGLLIASVLFAEILEAEP